VLYLSNAPDIRLLADGLASLLADPLADPMMSEWIAVPTAGMQRWTKLELARSLGASEDREDGVAANIEFVFPGRLRQLILEAGTGNVAKPGNDPWHIDHLVWAVLEELTPATGSRALEFMAPLAKGATQYARARRIADLFDRYSLHRPELVQSWTQGRDVDAAGNRLPQNLMWQPVLWRLVSSRIGVASPAERLPALLRDVENGRLLLDLPPRLSVFGVTTLPGSWLFLDLVRALSVQRDVHCYFLDPSQNGTDRVQTASTILLLDRPLFRAHRDVTGAPGHPLLASWGRLFQERAGILETARQRGLRSQAIQIMPVAERFPWHSPRTLLAVLQHEIRSDLAPTGSFEFSPDDRSFEVHKCHGPARQVEVLRDAILHLLEDDSSLSEDDIVVLCPAIEEFAPFIEAGFGVSASEADHVADLHPHGFSTGTPRLSYRLVDRSLRQVSPVIDALDALLSLISGRCTATEVLEFVALPSVRLRYGFDERALETIAYWVDMTMVRWGLSAKHRVERGFSEYLSLNTWSAAIDRLLMGIAMRDPESGMALGSIVPSDVEGDEIELAGRFVDLMRRVEVAQSVFSHPRSPQEWCEDLVRVSGELFATGPEQSWQLDRLHTVLKKISDGAAIDGREVDVELSLSEVRRVLGEELQGQSGRPDFFRGGITVSSLTPLRWLPFRIVCLLGFDEGTTTDNGLNGDDLMLLAPRLGDPDPRSEGRQSLLEALLVADERLIITLTAQNERTNLPVLPSVAFVELREAVMNTMTAASRDRWRSECEVMHPRQSYDDRNFEPDQLGHTGAWSFDSVALSGAMARREQEVLAAKFFKIPIDLSSEEACNFQLEDLRSFFDHPVRAFMKRRLGIYRPFEEMPRSDELLLGLNGLENSSIGRRLLGARLAQSRDMSRTVPDDLWWRREFARGTLPVGALAVPVREEIEGSVAAILESMQLVGIDGSRPPEERVDVSINEESEGIGACVVSGALYVGRFTDCAGEEWRGTWRAAYTRSRPSQELVAWLDLVLLTLHDPSVRWHALVIRRPSSDKASDGFVDLMLDGSSELERVANAHAGLAVILRCAYLGLTEPLPLFPRISRALHLGNPNEADWVSNLPEMGEGVDHDNVLAFGHLTLVELRSLPARVSDPGTGPFRAERLAHYLWGSYDRTVITNEQLPSSFETSLDGL
jgi:exodeoxyribonuclease V gamma subunit